MAGLSRDPRASPDSGLVRRTRMASNQDPRSSASWVLSVTGLQKHNNTRQDGSISMDILGATRSQHLPLLSLRFERQRNRLLVSLSPTDNLRSGKRTSDQAKMPNATKNKQPDRRYRGTKKTATTLRATPRYWLETQPRLIRRKSDLRIRPSGITIAWLPTMAKFD